MQSSKQTTRSAAPSRRESPALDEPGNATTDQTLGEHDTALEHIHLPPPTIWPLTVAGGVTISFLGLVTSFPVSVLGLIIAVSGVVQWVQELRHERH